jgi:hypothetical protein
VTVLLQGTYGLTGELELTGPSKNKFERAGVDVFFLDFGAQDLGVVNGLDIGFMDHAKQKMLSKFASLGGEEWCVALPAFSVTLCHHIAVYPLKDFETACRRELNVFALFYPLP